METVHESPPSDSMNETPLTSGRVLRGLPRSLDRRDPVSIGSDRGSDIRIEGADPHHSELRWNTDEEAWFVHDDPAPGLTLRNGKPIDSSRMFEGDELEIAGVRIRFAGGCLEERITSAQLRISLRDVSASAGGKKRLQGISFDVAPGSFVAILGPSGCGKSTLIQRVAGLAPYEGGIFFNGHDLRSEAEMLLPLMAYLPQAVEDTLYGDMTVREAMIDFVHCHLSVETTIDLATQLDQVGLADKIDASVAALSGGQKRRFALALALLREPQLLLLDEPTAGLDPAAEADIMELLRRIADQGRTVLCATHVLGSLDKCDSVLVLAPGGRQVFDGTPARAIDFFGSSDWLDVYRRLEDGKWNTQVPNVGDVASVSNLPSAPPVATFICVFRATFRRLLCVAFSKRNAPLFFGNPIGIGLVLALACGTMFRDGGDTDTICFCLSVAMFWLGVSGSVRSLVSERIPKRCLDRMRGVPLGWYFAAQVFYAAFSVAVQAALFLLPVFLLRHHAERFSPGAIPVFWLVMTFVGFAGTCVGLMVSAFAKKEIQAVWALPFVAVLALFLSKPVLESNVNGERKPPEGLLRVIECAMPTLYSQECLSSELARFRVVNPDFKALKRSRTNFSILAFAYPIVFLTLALFLQKRREEEWDGR